MFRNYLVTILNSQPSTVDSVHSIALNASLRTSKHDKHRKKRSPGPVVFAKNRLPNTFHTTSKESFGFVHLDPQHLATTFNDSRTKVLDPQRKDIDGFCTYDLYVIRPEQVD